jgi:hypothetical protein
MYNEEKNKSVISLINDLHTLNSFLSNAKLLSQSTNFPRFYEIGKYIAMLELTEHSFVTVNKIIMLVDTHKLICRRP